MALTQYIKTIQQPIIDAVKKSFPNVDISEDLITIDKAPQPEYGNFTFACFPLAKLCRQSPANIAKSVCENLTIGGNICKAEVVGAYINLYVNKVAFIECVCKTVLEKADQYGSGDTGKGQRVMIEYSSPNTNKPLHIGHVRNNLIGMALAKIMAFCGYDVIKVNLVNDRGVHICKSMLAYQEWGNGTTPESEKKKGDHFVGEFYVKFEDALKQEKLEYAEQNNIDLSSFSKDNIKKLRDEAKAQKDPNAKKELRKKVSELEKQADEFEREFLKNSQYAMRAQKMLQQWEEGDSEVRELWKTMNDWVMKGFGETYQTLGCEFDKFYFESDTYNLGKKYVEQGLENGVFERRENGSIWVTQQTILEVAKERFKGFSPKDKLLLRGDGTSVYMTQDIGTAILKNTEYSLDRCVIVVAEEQKLHFKILFTVLELLGFSWAKGCEHVSYGMVVLPKGMGKIKSREGTAVDADDLVQEMSERAEAKIREGITSGNIRVSEEDIVDVSNKIALSALKLYMLRVSLDKAIQFDPESEIKFVGDTGPYTQYSYARAQSIFAKASEEEKQAEVDYQLLVEQKEFELAQKISEFPAVVKASGENSSPNLVANYLVELSQTFSSFYGAHKVLKNDDKNLSKTRLTLCQVASQTLENCMGLLGIDVVASM